MAKSLARFTFAFIVTAPISLHALDEPRASLVPTADPAACSAPNEFVVHEWGTFTTFSGSDGVFLDFRSLDASQSDLPSYIRDRGSFTKNPMRLLTKRVLRGRVRMETPVTYFYTDRHRTVDVRVDFPEGLLTEFYPPVRSLQPAIDESNIFGAGETMGKSSLNWGKVDLIPTSQLVPNLLDPNLRADLEKSIVESLVPHASNEQHYATARQTDAAIVHWQDDATKASHFEKFLFYRGVGKFQLPFTAHFEGEQAVLKNSGTLPIRSAILIDVQGETIQATRIDNVESGQSLPFQELHAVSNEQLAKMVCDRLVAEGLFEKEAAAMVATWQQSWFTENGTRVLYMVPESITEKLLPLHISPQPQKMLRVLVGRMEIMSPSREKAMVQAVAQSVSDRAKHLEHQKMRRTDSPYTLPESIRTYGRMAEPALTRIASIAKESSIRREAELLFSEMQK